MDRELGAAIDLVVYSARVVVRSARVDHRAAARQPMLAINSALFGLRAVAGRCVALQSRPRCGALERCSAKFMA